MIAKEIRTRAGAGSSVVARQFVFGAGILRPTPVSVVVARSKAGVASRRTIVRSRRAAALIPLREIAPAIFAPRPLRTKTGSATLAAKALAGRAGAALVLRVEIPRAAPAAGATRSLVARATLLIGRTLSIAVALPKAAARIETAALTKVAALVRTAALVSALARAEALTWSAAPAETLARSVATALI